MGDPGKNRIRPEDHKFGCDEFGVLVRPLRRVLEWACEHRGVERDV